MYLNLYSNKEYELDYLENCPTRKAKNYKVFPPFKLSKDLSNPAGLLLGYCDCLFLTGIKSPFVSKNKIKKKI